jgi:hypothetical protein
VNLREHKVSTTACREEISMTGGQRKFHLAARQAGEIARAAQVGSVIAMHFSPRYVGEDRALLCGSGSGFWRQGDLRNLCIRFDTFSVRPECRA